MLASRSNKSYEPPAAVVVPAVSYKKKGLTTTEDGWTTRASKPVPGKFRIVGLEDESVSAPVKSEPEPSKPVVEEPKFESRDFPALSAGWPLPQEDTVKVSTWASVAAIVPPKPRARLSMAAANTIAAAIDVATEKKSSSPPVPVVVNKQVSKKSSFTMAMMDPKRSWADSSSDDEDW